MLSESSKKNPPNTHPEGVEVDQAFGLQTPLEKIVGIPWAEETYSLLTIREQLILDLLICGWTQAEIAMLFEVRAPSIASSVRRMRFKLADSKLQLVLETRKAFKENKL